MQDLIAARPPPQMLARRHGKGHFAGLLFLGLWIALGLGVIYVLIADYDGDMLQKYGPRILSGALVTLEVVGLSLAIGAVLSVPIAMGRLSSNPIWASLAFGYSYFFRGTPLLAQTFLVYYGAGEFSDFFKSIGLWPYVREAFDCAVLTFSLNTAAYQAEILSGAIRSVPAGQWQAAQALGLRRGVILFKIILPQALITALRPYGNEVILMVKGSAIASVITLLDLMGQTRYAYSRTYDLQIYLWAAILYLVTVETLRQIWDRLERRLTRHLKR